MLGYGLAILIGISLGLIGSGGSILTVPVLVYVMHISPMLSTAYSLFIVGLTALVGAGQYARKQLLDYRTAFVFGIPSIAAVYITRKWIVPLLPDEILHFNNFVLHKDIFIMLLFAVLMVLAAMAMIRPQRIRQDIAMNNHNVVVEKKYNYPLIFIEGILVGTLTGLVGAGGGFLIIPALVLLAKLPMQQAVGTSLLIIAAKSLIGFLGDVGNQVIDWRFLLFFSSFAIAGIFIGIALSKKVSSDKLKPAFGWFVLVMGCYIIIKEIWFK